MFGRHKENRKLREGCSVAILLFWSLKCSHKMSHTVLEGKLSEKCLSHHAPCHLESKTLEGRVQSSGCCLTRAPIRLVVGNYTRACKRNEPSNQPKNETKIVQ